MKRKITILLLATVFSSVISCTNENKTEKAASSKENSQKIKKPFLIRSKALTHKQFQALLNPNTPNTAPLYENDNLSTLEFFLPKNTRKTCTPKEFKKKYRIIKPPIAKTQFGIITKIKEKKRLFSRQSPIKVIKRIHKPQVVNPDQYKISCDCLKKEYLYLSQLNHQNIIKLEETVKKKRCNNPIGIITPWYPNDLFSLLNGELDRIYELGEAPTLTTEKIKQIAQNIAQGIKHIHKNNILHKDIKPENILLTEEETAIIADFGLSQQTRPGCPFFGYEGSPEYVAPEVLIDRTYSYPADIFSFGMLLYALTEMSLPYTRKELMSIDAIQRKKLSEKYPFSDMNPLFPNGNPFKYLIMQCTKACPEERPSIDEIIEILQSID